jgi:hypothetical protein
MNYATAANPDLSDGRPSIRYVLLSGLAWGVVVTTFESLSQPPLELSLSDYLMFYSRILLHYAVGGLLLAWLTALASSVDRRPPAWITVVPILATATAVALLIDRLSIWYVPFWSNDVMAMAAPPGDVAAHLAWNFGVYGGLYVLTFYFLQNETRTRERLRLTELARIGAEARMDRAMTEDRSPAIAPDLLLRALSELARRYDENDQRADRLLEKLVQLLRSVNSSMSKRPLKRESDLAAKLGRVCGELELTGQFDSQE